MSFTLGPRSPLCAAALLFLSTSAAQTTWTLPPQFRAAGYTREFRDGAMVLAGPGPSGALTQTIDAAPYRGQCVRLRATLRVEGPGAAQLLLRVDRPAALAFFDNMGDRPLRAATWTPVTLEGEVAPDAATIELGVLSTGPGAVSVKDIAFEKLPPPPAGTVAALRATYARVDAAFSAADLATVAALALPGAEIVLPNTRLKLADALAAQKGAKVDSHSTVTHVRVDGPEATVWVNNEAIAGDQAVLSSNRDVWVRAGDGWKLEQSTLIASRPATPPAVLAQVPALAGMPDWKTVRILLWQGDAPPAIPGFTPVPIEELDPRFADAAAARAVAWLKANAPEDAGPAQLAFEGADPARIAAIVRVFEQHRAPTAEWAYARHAALLVYQSKALHDHPEEAVAANIIWFASEMLPAGKLLAAVTNAAAVAPLVRARYGKQVYVAGTIPRELLGGNYFLDLSRIPPGTPLARWAAVQKFAFDAITAR